MILTVIDENGASREIPLDEDRVRIGRSRENEIFIPDPALSRFHALLSRQGMEWWVTDLGSRNRTFVNGQELSAPIRLQDGDEIRVGRTRLILGDEAGPKMNLVSSDRGEASRILGTLRVAETPENALTRILVEAAREITSNEAVDRVLRSLLSLALRATRAERGLLVQQDPGGQLVPVVWVGRDRTPPVISRLVVQRVLEEKEAVIQEDLPEDLAQAGTIVSAGIRSILCAPLGIGPAQKGLFYLDSCSGRADFQPMHLEVVTILAGMANVVLENAASRAQAERLRTMEAQVRAAAEIQAALMPPSVLSTPAGFSAAGCHRACHGVGGDLFDFFKSGESRLGVMLADVAGKGLAAALLMANLHARWQSVRLLGLEPGEWLGRLNDEMLRVQPTNRFVSMAFALADRERNTVLFASAGHNPALLAQDGQVERLDSTGPILGILPGQTIPCLSRTFGVGARLVIYSDGVTDQQNVAGESYGLERLTEVVRRGVLAAPADLVEAIREDLEAFAGEAPQDDDTTIVVLGSD